MASEKNKVKFHYLKSQEFRVIHADGIFGGVTPTGDIFITLFNQRPPIPNLAVHPILENGDLGDEILSERVTKDGIIRELEIGVTMRPEVAEGMIKWLQEKVENLAELKKKAEESKTQK